MNTVPEHFRTNGRANTRTAAEKWLRSQGWTLQGGVSPGNVGLSYRARQQGVAGVFLVENVCDGGGDPADRVRDCGRGSHVLAGLQVVTGPRLSVHHE